MAQVRSSGGRRDEDTLLRVNEERLRLALAATGQGLYDLDIPTGIAQVTPEYLGMLGEDAATGEFDLRSFGSRIHPDDAERVGRVVEDYIVGRTDEYREEFRIRHADGHWVWVLSIGRVVQRDAEGRAVRVLGTHTDVSERHETDEALAESERRMSTLLANLPGLVYRCRNDRNWTMEFMSEGARDLLGYAPADLVDNRALCYADCIHPDDREMVWRTVQSHLNGSLPYQLSYRIVHASGEVRWVWEQGRGVFQGDELVALEGVIQDVTQATLGRERLDAAEAYSRDLIEIANAIVVGLDREGRVTTFNRAAEEITGYSRTEVVGRSWFDLVCPRERYPDVWREFERLTCGGAPRRFENPILTRDGAERWIVWNNGEVRDGERVVGTISFGIDMTDSRRAEQELRRTKVLLESIVNGTDDAVYVKDTQGRYLLFNRAAERITGMPVKAVIGRDDTLLFPESEARALMEGDRGIMESAQTRTLEEHVTAADGEVHHFLSTKGPIMGPGGRVEGLFGIAKDITERVVNEQQVRSFNVQLEERVRLRTAEIEAANRELAQMVTRLEEANRRLDEATRSKDEFLANMSHELRTPLNSVIGFSGVLLQGVAGALNEEQARQLTMVNNAGRHLLVLINEVLDLAKIESGHMSVHAEPFCVTETVTEVVQSLRPIAAEKGINLIWPAWPDVELETDSVRVEQILLNLVGNAVKFTDSGSVAVALAREPGRVRVSVADTGRGIAADDLERVFEDFYQGAPSKGAKSAGTGLGLAVSRKLARMLGGDISVSSSPGEGSTFTLDIPDVLAGVR